MASEIGNLRRDQNVIVAVATCLPAPKARWKGCHQPLLLQGLNFWVIWIESVTPFELGDPKLGKMLGKAFSPLDGIGQAKHDDFCDNASESTQPIGGI